MFPKIVEFGSDEDGPVTGNFLLIPSGVFYVGSNDKGGRSYAGSGGRRLAVITKPFYMQETPVTQRQYKAVADYGYNPSVFSRSGPFGWDLKAKLENPVEQVSWNDAITFCRKLGPQFRLPTEMEWEWAARGGDGDKYIYAGSNDPDEVAWTDQNSNIQTHPVKQKKPNGYDLYDMSGNVREWCSAWYSTKREVAAMYPNQELIDYKGPTEGVERVSRGGSWHSPAVYARVAYRDRDIPDHRHSHDGFRLVMDVPT